MANGNTKFINSLFLKTLVEREFDVKDVKIKSYNLEELSEKAPGSATRSVLNRLFVKYEMSGGKMDVASFVIKVKPTKGELADEFKACSDFSKETSTYKTVLPTFVDNLKKAGVKIEFTPRIVTIFNIPTEGMVFEEVTNRGYHTQFELTGLTKEQSVLALQKLAIFHASSAMSMQNKTIDMEKYSKGTFHTNLPKLIYFEEAYRMVVESASEIGIDKEIAKKLEEFSGYSLKKAVEDYSSTINDFKVLNHGDYWTKNILFKYKGNELVDSIFVDLQNVVIGSPLIDLFYFLTTSVNVDVLESSRDELIFQYHKKLTETLEKMSFKGYVPSLNEFQIEVLKRQCLEMYFMLTIAPYLRTPSPRITTAIQPNLYKEEYLRELKDNGKKVLAMNKKFIKNQLTRLNGFGALDHSVNEGFVKSMKNKFNVK